MTEMEYAILENIRIELKRIADAQEKSARDYAAFQQSILTMLGMLTPMLAGLFATIGGPKPPLTISPSVPDGPVKTNT